MSSPFKFYDFMKYQYLQTNLQYFIYFFEKFIITLVIFLFKFLLVRATVDWWRARFIRGRLEVALRAPLLPSLFPHCLFLHFFVRLLCNNVMLSTCWHKSTQESFCLCYLLNAKKDRIMCRLVSLKQSWDLVAHFEPISESTPTVLLLPLVS